MQKSFAGNKQAGFTLIELVVVIVILGILAATALPRFANLQSNARTASVQGLVGGLNSVMAIAHAQSLVSGNNAAATGTVAMDGIASVTLAYGYPDGTATGITAAMASLSGWTITYSGSVATYQPTSGGSATCQVTYTAATSTTVTPVVTPTTTGC